MSAVYSRQQTVYGGSFASDLAALTIAGRRDLPLGIVQNVRLSYAQSVARIYDVSNGGGAIPGGSDGSGNGVPVFYVGGRTNGQGSIARVLGPQSGALCEFYRSMGSVCSPQDLSFTFRGGCSPQVTTDNDTARTETADLGNAAGTAQLTAVKYSIQGALMTNLGITVGAQDMIVNENIDLMFANLECDKITG